MKTTTQVITCSTCGCQTEQDHLSRNCSNCFSCTGCERYTCPQCNEEIIIKDINPVYPKRNKNNL